MIRSIHLTIYTSFSLNKESSHPAQSAVSMTLKGSGYDLDLRDPSSLNRPSFKSCTEIMRASRVYMSVD
jgi:hypothetical protein